MILKFKDDLNNQISLIQTNIGIIRLNLEIDFEEITTGSGRILHNGISIGTFSRSVGSPVDITFINGNFTREVKHNDTFQLVVDIPTGISTVATLNIQRIQLHGIPKLPSTIQTVKQFQVPFSLPKILTHDDQINILRQYKSNIVPKHISQFVRELLYPIRDIYHPQKDAFPVDDTFYCSQGVVKIITTDEILNNDFVRVSGGIQSDATADVLEVTGIKSVVGGTVIPVLFNGKITSLRFTSSVGIGSLSTFVCEIKNKNTNSIHESNVVVYTKAPHPVNAVNDVYSVIQWNTLNLTKTQLLSNDVGLNPPLTFVEIVPGTISRGNINISGDNISFVGTGFAGQPAGFQYRIKDSKNNMSVGSVSIDVLELPQIEVYLFSTVEATAFMNSYIPPTLTQIYNTWARISNNGLYFPPGTTPTGEAASWELYGSGFRCTVNSVYLTGFISPKAYDTYTHEATLSSVAADNDTIALIIAFKRDGTTNRVLLAIREPGGMTGYTGSTSWSLATNINGTISVIAKLTSYSIVQKLANWPQAGNTRVRVERIGSMITAYCSQFATTNILTASKLEIDLNNYPELAWALEKCPYGYACQSQQYSTYSNVVFEGGMNANEIFDFDLNCTWEYVGGVWTKNTSKTIQSALGYPRTVINPENGYTYRIEQNSITRIS